MPRSDKRESRRINVNLEAKLSIGGQTYPVLIGNLSETGLYVILPVPPGTSASLEGITDAEVKIRISQAEILDLPCKKLWASEIPDSPLVQRIGLLLKSPSAAYRKFYKSLSYQARTEITRGPVAVVGLACYYPGAPNIQLLWENIVSRRRQFRRMPDVRLPLKDYYDPDPAAEDKTYGTKAAVIDGFSFDWIKRGIPKSVVDSTDISHWLALETALKALEDAGLSPGSVPPDRTGVILGNSLTGEQSRAEGLRLRWPFVLKTLLTAADDTGLPPEMSAALATNMEAYYKSVFAPVTEDTLAGGLSNTIAGRICNFLNLNGGGYTVDGACSSSLLAVTTAATALANGNLDLAIAGGVDISLDTFELVGFAKTRALTRDEMRVYDRRANGFIPGEGAGFVVLKRLEDARADGDYIYAVLRGWGISTDGKGALTAPKAETQALAIRRAYTGSGYGFGDIDFVEGHGTGTPAGDTAELSAIAEVLGDRAKGALRPCGITSLKSLIGHTKAASGIGGFLKAVLAVNRRVLPPTANCTEPSRTFEKPARLVYPIMRGEIRPPQEILRAGVSGMGFGGINCHITLESGDAPAAGLAPGLEERRLLASAQETELFILGGPTPARLLERVRAVRQLAFGMSVGEMVDLAAQLSREVEEQALVRAALIADSPESLAEGLQELESLLSQNPPLAGEKSVSPHQNLLVGHALHKTRVGFLFPGQGSQQLNMARFLVERHEWARELCARASSWLKEENGGGLLDHMFKPLERALDQSRVEAWAAALQETTIAQPAICLAALLWCRKLERLGITPVAAGGHSLGELAAFHAADAFDESALLKLAALRGQAMTAASGARGVMASLACAYDTAAAILGQVQGYAVAANINSPQQLVISGEQAAVEQAVDLARARGINARLLKVSNAFHSSFVAGAAEILRSAAPVPLLLGNPKIKLFSGIGGTEMRAGLQLRDHFAEQVISQVDFVSIVHAMARECDLLLEVGPAKVLSGLVRAITGGQGPLCLPVESRPGRDRDLHLCLAHLFVQGGEINWPALYEDRLVRPFVPASARAFIVNPCERPFKPDRTATVKTVAAEGNSLPATLTAATGLDPQLLGDYLVRRGPFLRAMIKADMENLPANLQQLEAVAKSAFPAGPAPQVPDRTAQAAGVEKVHASGDTAIADLLLGLVEKMTGFPKDTLSLQLRLLDDLNLDSIKSAGLLAEAAMRLGVAGDFDTSRYANAPLAEVIETLRSLTAGRQKDSQPAAKKEGAAEVIFALIAKRTGFPRQSLSAGMRLLDDLNLDSIKAAELLAEAAKGCGVAGDMDVSQYANSTVAEIAAAFDGFIVAKGQPAAAEPEVAAKAVWPTWVRNFAVAYVEEELTPSETRQAARGRLGERLLILCRAEERGLAESLREHFAGLGAQAEVLEYEEVLRNEQVGQNGYTTFIGIQQKTTGKAGLARESLIPVVERLQIVAGLACRAPEAGPANTVVFIQFGGGFFGQGPETCDVAQCPAAALAASLHLERPDLRVRVLDFDAAVEAGQVAAKAAAEMAAGEQYAASGYDRQLTRRVPRLTLQEPRAYTGRALAWSAADVILVTGGAKGITAACALALARQTGVRMALVGSSPHPEAEHGAARSREIAQTLARFQEAGLRASYYQCDIVDREAVQSMVRQVRQELGPITGVMHGSALNKPRDLAAVSSAEALREISPKVLGAVNLCEALKDQPPRLFISFSSIIGVSGMARNGWYGFSNQALDLLMRRFAEEHPATAVQSMAFSIWDEIGMGVRLGSIAHLAQRGIAAIPAQEGVRRFLQLLSHDPGEQQVVIAARLANLDTIQAAQYPRPGAARFLERLLSYTPDVEVVVRAQLNLAKDAYVEDHNWRGTLLFPTVFGLEAMAQAVAWVTGISDFSSVRLENISLARPIPVSPEKGIEIEIRAEVLERQAGEIGRRVQVSIGTEQTAFATPHFSATFVLGVERQAPPEEIVLPEQPLDIDPKEDLYNGKLLFQGPRFQRLVKVHALDSDHCVFQTTLKASTEENDRQFTGQAEPSWLIGDPYFRDSLLHAVQLSIIPDICLPFTIASIERYDIKHNISEPLIGMVHVESHTADEAHTSVTVKNSKGQILERLHGYVLKVLERHEDFPTPADLADPGPRDEDIIRRKVIACCKELALKPPHIAVAYLANLQQMTKSERHEKELPLLKRAVGQLGNYNDDVSISWHESGKPCITEASGENHISLSHDQGTVLCVAGENPQGCDLQSIPVHTEEEWLALLGKRRKPLLDALTAEGDSINQAGTRIWAACEAVFKQSGQKNQDIMIRSRIGDSVVFQTEGADAKHTVLTIPLSLSRKPERMLAVSALAEKEPEKQSCQELSSYHAERLNYDLAAYKAEISTGPFGQAVFNFYFPMTFRESANPSRTLYFSQYFDWIGKLREYMVQPIYEGLVQSYTSGRWGTVTNGAEVDIFGEARSGDTIAGSVWLENISGKEQATLDFGFAWRKVLDKGHQELIAIGKVSTTWVEILGHGVVDVRPLPEYVQDYFKKLLPDSQVKSIPLNTLQPEIAADFGEELHREPEGPVRNAALLREEIFQSSLENANLVGNIYYSNYYKWQGVTRDNFLNAILPEYFDNSGNRGELRCVHCKVNHLHEAMPFDRILVRMYKKAVYEKAVWLYTDYYRLDQDGKRHKLGYGEHKAVWHAPDQEGRWLPAKLPKALIRALLPEKVAQAKAYNRYPLSNKDATHEVIIIGAGIGGLTAGALLAKRGKRVLVLDQHSKPGGFCTSWERQVKRNGKTLRFVFDAGVHDILGLGGHGHIRKLLRDLDVENRIEWRRVDHQYIVDDLRISVPRDLDRYIDLLCEQFPEEHEGITRLFNEMHKIYASLYSKRSVEDHLSRWLDMPFLAMLDEFIKDRRLKEIISILSCYITDDKSKIKTLTIAPLFGEYFEGGYYPVGGPQVFSNTLAQVLKDAGGALACNTSVSRILVEKDAVIGVELGDGEKLYAPMVISNADLIQTFSRLIEPGYWPPYFAERLKELRPSNSAFLINLGLDFVPDVAPTTLMCMNNSILAIMTPSRIDPRLAPEGHSSMTLVTLIPNEEAATWRREEKGYAARKKSKGDALISQAEQVIPGLSAHIVYRQDASPATFARYARSTNGAIYATLIDGWKPSPKTPVQGLFLTGASISARPGVGDAVYSGMLTCDVLLRHDIRN
ncbi:MAG: SDR family NAD(P)-dependent oxidoreductase [Desulfurivibrio sp.]|nr:MAG: SDR family NAD(P)-dependent oxidoreductase [Desulfurivibrio sp.]